MSEENKDLGIIEVVLERMEKQRLPRLLAMKEKVDNDESLDNYELDFLEQAMTDGRRLLPLIDKHPEYQPLAAQVMALCKDISDRALQNG